MTRNEWNKTWVRVKDYLPPELEIVLTIHVPTPTTTEAKFSGMVAIIAEKMFHVSGEWRWLSGVKVGEISQPTHWQPEYCFSEKFEITPDTSLQED